MGMSNWVHLDVEQILRETDDAFLLQLTDRMVWIPRSQIDSADQYEAGDEDVTVSVSEWIARKKGLDA